MITSQNDDPGCATKDQFHSMNHILSLISLMNVWSHKVHAYVDKALINLSECQEGSASLLSINSIMIINLKTGFLVRERC